MFGALPRPPEKAAAEKAAADVPPHEKTKNGVQAFQALLADKTSVDKAPDVQFVQLIRLRVSMALLADMTSADKAPYIQGDERELLQLAMQGIGSGQLSTSEIGDLLGTVTNLWPDFREAIDEARLVIVESPDPHDDAAF